MAQSPTIAIPKKSTEEVDWTGPIRAIIKTSYGENPDNYAAECASLQRCRQDAVRGAGSDLTAASLLTKYFGQLELLELRFSEIRVTFPWKDAFTAKLTTQTSMAFEKASIIYQIAATHSSIASAQNRSDPEGLKRAHYYFRTCAGMLTYINDNFLHAPSTDLSREVVKFLVGITMAQANETFYETCIDQRKSPTLVSKVASHTASLYNGLCDEVKEFMGKGIFDRNWVTLLQIKSKYFNSLMQYHRSLADSAAGKHGEALSRMAVAESNAKEAHKLAGSFSPYFVNTISTTLPADCGTAILELTKTHLALCTEKHAQGQKDNDLIYNAPVPSEATLAPIDKISAVTAVPIQDVYGTPEVQKTIGPDLFSKLIPLSVHEGASVYSEEKAKIVRAEVEKADISEGEVKASLESLGVRSGLGRFKEIAEGEIDTGVPTAVIGWQEEIRRRENGVGEGVESQLKELETLKTQVAGLLNGMEESLANESRECENMRVQYGHKWTQEPSGGHSKQLRQYLKEHRSSLEAAAPSDKQVYTLWSSVRGDVALLMARDQLDGQFAGAAGGQGDLLDATDGDTDDAERERMGKLVREIEERLGRINKISRERNEILKDLKEKVQNDDVSHLLLLNRRNSGVEPSLFANELEKFRPYQARLASTSNAQQATIAEIASLWKGLRDKGAKGKGAKKWEERERRVGSLVKRFAVAREGYLEVSDGVMKGLQFYKDLTSLTKSLQEKVTTFVNTRNRERETLAGRLQVEAKLNSAPSAPPALPPPPPRPLESAFSSMNLGGPPAPSPYSQPTYVQQQQQRMPPPPPPSSNMQPPPPPAASPYSYTSFPSAPQNAPTSYIPQQTTSSPPPPPATNSDPYANMFGSMSPFGTSPAPAHAGAPALAPPVSHPISPPPPPLMSGQGNWAGNNIPAQPSGSVYGHHVSATPTPLYQARPPQAMSPPPSHHHHHHVPTGSQQLYGGYQQQPQQQQQQQQQSPYGYPNQPPPHHQPPQQQPASGSPGGGGSVMYNGFSGFPPPPPQPTGSYQYPR